jgi:hypothetical protein
LKGGTNLVFSSFFSFHSGEWIWIRLCFGHLCLLILIVIKISHTFFKTSRGFGVLGFWGFGGSYFQSRHGGQCHSFGEENPCNEKMKIKFLMKKYFAVIL